MICELGSHFSIVWPLNQVCALPVSIIIIINNNNTKYPCKLMVFNIEWYQDKYKYVMNTTNNYVDRYQNKYQYASGEV